MIVTKAGNGVYRVEHDGRADVVYVAGPPEDRWVFCSGDVYRVARETTPGRRGARADATQTLAAPMPATVLGIFVEPGATVKTGDIVIVLEAMKMELPLRAPGDAIVSAVHCKEGDLVQPDTVLVELKELEAEG